MPHLLSWVNMAQEKRNMALTKVRAWTVEEYHRMLETGILTVDDRVELLEGQVIEMSPQEPPHAATTRRASRYLDRLFNGRADVRAQLPITLHPKSEPEPDIAIVQLQPNEYADRHPAAADIFLIIEVSDTTLRKDRKQKALIYASAGIPEYWILDLNKRQVLIFRDSDGKRYQTELSFLPDHVCTLAILPDIQISLSELFLPM